MTNPGVWLVPAALLLLVPLWRFLPWLALALSPLALGLAWWFVCRHRAEAVRALPWVGCCCLLIAALRIPGDALWPCELACAAGKAFEGLLGVPAVWWAAGGTIVWIVAAWRRWALLVPVLAAMTGVSLAYLTLLVRLHSLCGHCLAVHVCVLAGMLLAGAVPASRWLRYGPLVAAGLAVIAIHAGMDMPRPPVEPPPGGVLGAPPMAPPGVMP